MPISEYGPPSWLSGPSAKGTSLERFPCEDGPSERERTVKDGRTRTDPPEGRPERRACSPAAHELPDSGSRADRLAGAPSARVESAWQGTRCGSER